MLVFCVRCSFWDDQSTGFIVGKSFELFLQVYMGLYSPIYRDTLNN